MGFNGTEWGDFSWHKDPMALGDPGDLPELDHGAGWLAIHHR